MDIESAGQLMPEEVDDFACHICEHIQDIDNARDPEQRFCNECMKRYGL